MIKSMRSWIQDVDVSLFHTLARLGLRDWMISF